MAWRRPLGLSRRRGLLLATTIGLCGACSLTLETTRFRDGSTRADVSADRFDERAVDIVAQDAVALDADARTQADVAAEAETGSGCSDGMTLCQGRCVATLTDNSNCGRCGMICGVVHNAEVMCSAGACVFRCAAGFADCNMRADDGCEVQLGTPANCARCGDTCAVGVPVCQRTTGGTFVCATGCDVGLANCDGSCANLASDPLHCGTCSTVCPTPPNSRPSCFGTCGITCLTGFGNCDASRLNGCEANLLTSATNCGACGRVCPSGMICTAGACACPTGLTLCGSRCVNIASDPANCGTCTRTCPSGGNGSATCVGGMCRLACATGFGNCNGNASDGCEADLRRDLMNCGGCGVSCATTGACVASACMTVTACMLPRVMCGAICTDTATDPMNCGACGSVCSGGVAAGCSGGACLTACTAGMINCGRGCTSLLTDRTNCGGCGLVCPTGFECGAGTCANCGLSGLGCCATAPACAMGLICGAGSTCR